MQLIVYIELFYNVIDFIGCSNKNMLLSLQWIKQTTSFIC